MPVLLAWLAVIVAASLLASRLASVVQGGADPIPGSQSDQVTSAIRQRFGAGTLYQFLLVMSDSTLAAEDPAFATAARRAIGSLEALPSVRAVHSFWSTGRRELLGSDGHTALALVTPNVSSYYEAERLTATLRASLARVPLPATFSLRITGATAVLYDLDQRSSSDLLAAERVGLPLTLVILMLVFGAPLAAMLPILLALASVTIGLAGLFILHRWIAVSVFAENVVSMIGLGVGVDYALFILSRFREEMRRGADAEVAAARAAAAAGHAVLFSGATVAIGFLALFMVRAPFLHTIALGGMFVVAAAVAASMTLLPVLLAWFGRAVHWPRALAPAPSGGDARARFWARWAHGVMRRPWISLVLALAVLGVFAEPVSRLKPWNIGAQHLPAETEARAGYETLAHCFGRGWMGPIVMLVEARPGATVWAVSARRAALDLIFDLGDEPRIAEVQGFPRLLTSLGPMADMMRSRADLPESMRATAPEMVSADGRTALIALMTREAPESPESMKLLRELRAKRWPGLEAAGLRVRFGGASAVMADFDDQLFGSLPRVVLAVLALTFVTLMLLFRSLLIPLKATVLNALSVLAAYGFLVLVFQDGLGAKLLHLDPPGGLNSFIVLMLFTILFGLSMDYEVFLLSRIREEYQMTGDNARAVAEGLGQTAAIITSAALIMISIFASFGFTRLIPTREFGLGLAFAVLLDATLIRVVLVPALMVVTGKWNWWVPEWMARTLQPRSRQR